MTETISQLSLGRSSTNKEQKRIGKRMIPAQPAKVLATSIYSGLAALVRLAERRVTKDPEVIKLYNEIKQMWKEARTEYRRLKMMGVLDFTPILNIEHNMRKNYLGMVWFSTRPYGNTEVKRVYNWREGTIGPLNELLNYAGAMLRSIATKYYSFPKVHYYQVREYPDGKVELIYRSKAMKYPPEEGVKVSWAAAYPGSSKYSLVRVRHSTLPEMDFVDMIRAHVIELVRQCFIHNVPMTDSRRYIRLLINRLQPFLDWVYTDGAIGRGRFWPDADKVLREIVLEARAIYSRRVGRTPRLTQQLESGFPRESTLVDIVTQINKTYRKDSSKEMRLTTSELLKLMGYQVDKKRKTLIMRADTSSAMKKALSRLAEDMEYKTREVDQLQDSIRPALADDDARELYDRILQVTQREGNDWHRVLVGDMFHPSSLRQVVYAGDNFLDEPSDYLIAVEVPVKSITGSGKADIVVFIRRSVGGEIFWTPIMMLDVKTKTGINWAVRGKRPRTEKENSRVPGFVVRKRPCTSTEWSKIVSSTPNPTELSQLQSYESGLVYEYADLVKQDTDRPKTLWKGIVLLDSDEDRETMFTLLPQLVQSVITDLKADSTTEDSRTLYTLNSQGVQKKWQYKFGLVLLSSQGPQHLLGKTKPLETIIEDDPFKDRVKDDVHFTLYLTVPSGGSSGDSAAWISRNWHLLHYLSDLKRKKKKQRVVWLDLIGDLTERSVRLQRLRLVGDQKPGRMSRRRLESLQQLAEKIKFQDLSSSLEEYFFKDARAGIRHLEEKIRKHLRQTSSERSIIVIDGWSQLRNIIPSHLDSLLETLEHRIIEWLPKRDVEIIWLDRPIPIPIQSATYQQPRVTPLPHDSPRRALLDEVIWNLPTSPRNFGWRTPRREDIRIIAQDTPTSSEPTVKSFGVPHLRGWARRFRADSKKERTVSVEEVFGDTETYGRSFYSASYVEIGPDSRETVLDDIYHLVPSLSRVRDVQKSAPFESPENNSQSTHATKKQVLGKTTRSRGMWDRASFIPQFTEPHRGRPGTYSSIENITRGRVRKPFRDIPAVSRTSRRPPVVRSTPVEAIDTDQTRHDEVLRVHRTAEFLMTKCDLHINSRWHGVLERTIQLCKKYQKGEITSLKTLDQLQALYPSLESSEELWNDLSYERRFGRGREQIPRSILPEVRERPELLTRYGVSLFLLLHGVMNDESTPEIQRSHIPTLWSAVADWQWVHMGFIPRGVQGLTQHRFDIPALWSNLLWRARWLISGPLKSGLLESHRLGELIPRGNDQLWLVFQEKPMSERMIAGLLTGVGRSVNLWGTYDTEVDLVPLAEDAEYTLEDSPDVQSIVITRFEEMDLLWAKFLEEYDERVWALIGKIVYRPPKEGRCAPIRKVTVSGVPKKVIERLTEPDVDIPADLGERVKDTLGQIVDDATSLRSVSIKVSMNEDDQRYLIYLVGGDGILLEELTLETTEEVIGVLRSPFTKGEYFQLADGGLYTWNPKTDISYEQIITNNGPLSLTFLRPRVENERFLNGTYVLPRTAKDVLETSLGDELLMVASPNLDRYKKDWKRCWNVWFMKSDVGERLRSMEYEYCTIYDIALIFECMQIIDTDTELRYPTRIVINNLEKVDLPDELTRRSRMRECLTHRGELANLK